MGTERYPKSGKPMHGDSKSAKFAPGTAQSTDSRVGHGSKSSYPKRVHGDLDTIDSRQNRATFARANSPDAMHSVRYPGKGHKKFPTEGRGPSLKAPMSDVPGPA